LYISSTCGILQISTAESKLKWLRTKPENAEMTMSSFRDIAVDNTGSLWVCGDDGIAYNSGGKWHNFSEWLDVTDTENRLCSHITFDNNNNLYASDNRKLFRWNGRNWTTYDKRARILINDNAGNIWTELWRPRPWIIDAQTGNLTTPSMPDSIHCPDGINRVRGEVVRDRTGAIWTTNFPCINKIKNGTIYRMEVSDFIPGLVNENAHAYQSNTVFLDRNSQPAILVRMVNKSSSQSRYNQCLINLEEKTFTILSGKENIACRGVLDNKNDLWHIDYKNRLLSYSTKSKQQNFTFNYNGLEDSGENRHLTYMDQSQYPFKAVVDNSNTAWVLYVRKLAKIPLSTDRQITDASEKPVLPAGGTMTARFSILPGQKMLHLNFPVGSDKAHSIFRLFDSSGRCVMTRRLVPAASHTLDLHSLSTGVYFFTLERGTEILRNRFSIVR
jgi:ligand-binding sensor domain-containing protein